MHIQRASDRTAVPWRNGRGVQYEIVTVEDDSSAMRWRLSTADLEADAPFSEFPGVEREFCVASGNGVTLRVDGVARRCDRGSITRFDGGATTDMTLTDGPCRAVNLMRPAGAAGPFLEVLMPGDSAVARAVVAIGEHATVTWNDSAVDLAALDAVLADAPRRVVCTSGQVVVCVDERPRPSITAAGEPPRSTVR